MGKEATAFLVTIGMRGLCLTGLRRHSLAHKPERG